MAQALTQIWISFVGNFVFFFVCFCVVFMFFFQIETGYRGGCVWSDQSEFFSDFGFFNLTRPLNTDKLHGRLRHFLELQLALEIMAHRVSSLREVKP